MQVRPALRPVVFDRRVEVYELVVPLVSDGVVEDEESFKVRIRGSAPVRPSAHMEVTITIRDTDIESEGPKINIQALPHSVT